MSSFNTPMLWGRSAALAVVLAGAVAVSAHAQQTQPFSTPNIYGFGDPLEAINRGFVEGVHYVGEQFGLGEMFLPDLVMGGEAMKMAVSILEPEMRKRGSARQRRGPVGLGSG